MYFVYLLQSKKDGNYYIGQTDNLKVRLEEHNGGRVRSTRDRTPFVMLGYEEYATRDESRWREYSLKKSAWKRKIFFEKFKCSKI